jgi:hypothetical protein
MGMFCRSWSIGCPGDKEKLGSITGTPVNIDTHTIMYRIFHRSTFEPTPIAREIHGHAIPSVLLSIEFI